MEAEVDKVGKDEADEANVVLPPRTPTVPSVAGELSPTEDAADAERPRMADPVFPRLSGEAS